jgi:hypothetical protein
MLFLLSRDVFNDYLLEGCATHPSTADDLRRATLVSKTWNTAAEKNVIWHEKIQTALIWEGKKAEQYSPEINYKKIALLFLVKKYPFSPLTGSLLPLSCSTVLNDTSLGCASKVGCLAMATICSSLYTIVCIPCTVPCDYSDYREHRASPSDQLCLCRSCVSEQESFRKEISTELGYYQDGPRKSQILEQLKTILPLRPKPIVHLPI